MKTRYSLLLLGSMLLSSCNQKEIPCHVNERFIYFDYPKQENTGYDFSFINTKEQEIDVAIPVAFSGRTMPADLSYSIEINEEKTTLDKSEYRLSEAFAFKAGMAKDTFLIRLIQSPRMDDAVLKLSVRIISDDNFFATMDGLVETEISVSNILCKPNWWDIQVEEYYLGRYSDKKYQLFRNEIFTGDFSQLSEDEKRMFALQFKYYLQKNPQTEDDGTSMSVPIVG